MSARWPDWSTDASVLSLGAADLLLLFGADHSLGGIPSYGVAETTDENPELTPVREWVDFGPIAVTLDAEVVAWTDGAFATRWTTASGAEHRS